MNLACHPKKEGAPASHAPYHDSFPIVYFKGCPSLTRMSFIAAPENCLIEKGFLPELP